MRTLTPQQQTVIDWVQTGSGSALVSAVAGAGKTTTLVEAMKHMQGKVLCLAFNRTIANEMKERAPAHVQVMTSHAFGNNALSRDGVRRNLDKWKDANLAKDMFPRLSQARRNEIARLQGMFKQFLIDPAKPDAAKCSDIVDAYEFDHADIPLALDMLKASNLQADDKRKPIISFDDMVYLAPLRGLVPPLFDWVLVDECQDLNDAQREIVRQAMKPGARLLACGDPRQAIYAFRGANAESFDLIRSEFSAIDLPLTVSFRCPRNVVNEARRFVSHIEAHETAPAGVVEVMGKESAVDRMQRGDTVVCRFNAPLVSLAYRLLSEGRPARIVGRNIAQGLTKLAQKWAARDFAKLRDDLARWVQLEKNKESNSAATLQRVEDQAFTLSLLMDALEDDGKTLVSDLVAWLEANFSDEAEGFQGVTLCTIHKAKGLEWPAVYYWGSDERPKGADEGQEDNLSYVAITRAQERLVLVPRVRDRE